MDLGDNASSSFLCNAHLNAFIPLTCYAEIAPPVSLHRIDRFGGTEITCDRGVSDLAFTKSESANEWRLYVKCHGEKRTYTISIR